MSKIVAITGQSGSGKSTISSYYRMIGYPVIDCDEIAKNVHNNQDCLKDLSEKFGQDIIVDGKLDKLKLSQKAFVNNETLQTLTDTTHPYIIKELLEIIEEYKKQNRELIFVDGAVIIDNAFEEYCDEIIVVVTNKQNQIERLMKRDNISRDKVIDRIENQLSYARMIGKADYVINNNNTIGQLIIQAQFVLKQI